MDHTVELVQAYLQVNGYFTVAEYPIVTVNRKGEAKVATDLDLLGFRFPGAGAEPQFVGGAASDQGSHCAHGSSLEVPRGQT